MPELTRRRALLLAADASVVGADGLAVSLTVDGTSVALTPGGSWSGALVVSVG